MMLVPIIIGNDADATTEDILTEELIRILDMIEHASHHGTDVIYISRWMWGFYTGWADSGGCTYNISPRLSVERPSYVHTIRSTSCRVEVRPHRPVGS